MNAVVPHLSWMPCSRTPVLKLYAQYCTQYYFCPQGVTILAFYTVVYVTLIVCVALKC